MIVIGLTGGIASGKSTVSQMLTTKGAKIIDADEIARELVLPGLPAWQQIKTQFGNGVLAEGGQLNRKKLAQLIFANEEMRIKLDKIMLPKIIHEIKLRLTKLKEQKEQIVVVDAPLLFEAGLTDLVQTIWVVYVPVSIQLERLMQRDGINLEQAKMRLASQMPLIEKKQLAHRVIDNSKTLANTYYQVEELWSQLMNNKL